MKTINVSAQAVEVHALLEQARAEDLLIQTADGTEFLVTAVDEFDHELVRTRQNARLMALLDERAKQTRTVSLEDAKRQLGLTS
jgi:hypothetical protein